MPPAARWATLKAICRSALTRSSGQITAAFFLNLCIYCLPEPKRSKETLGIRVFRPGLLKRMDKNPESGAPANRTWIAKAPNYTQKKMYKYIIIVMITDLYNHGWEQGVIRK